MFRGDYHLGIVKIADGVSSAHAHGHLQCPTSVTNGTQNLMGALKVAMGMCGAYTIRDFHNAEMVIAPAIKTEGKFFQMAE